MNLVDLNNHDISGITCCSSVYLKKHRSQTPPHFNHTQVRPRTATLHNKPGSAPTTAQRNHTPHFSSATNKYSALRGNVLPTYRPPCKPCQKAKLPHSKQRIRGECLSSPQSVSACSEPNLPRAHVHRTTTSSVSPSSAAAKPRRRASTCDWHTARRSCG